MIPSVYTERVIIVTATLIISYIQRESSLWQLHWSDRLYRGSHHCDSYIDLIVYTEGVIIVTAILIISYIQRESSLWQLHWLDRLYRVIIVTATLICHRPPSLLWYVLFLVTTKTFITKNKQCTCHRKTSGQFSLSNKVHRNGHLGAISCRYKQPNTWNTSAVITRQELPRTHQHVHTLLGYSTAK